MSEIQFLTFADIVEIHEYQIENFGGASGLRDIELLKSAIGMPESTFGGAFLHPTIYEMAAAYLYHLVENHPLQMAISVLAQWRRWFFWTSIILILMPRRNFLPRWS